MKRKTFLTSFVFAFLFLISLSMVGCGSPKIYNITYELDGGINNADNPLTYQENNEVITLKNPTKQGYTFLGWYENSKDGTKVTEIAKKKNKDIKLYAKWTLSSYQLKFDSNGGKFNIDGKEIDFIQRQITYTSKLSNFPIPKRSEFNFNGWWTEKTGGNQITENTNFTWTENKTLFAHWTPIEKVTISHTIPTEVKQNQEFTFTITLKNIGKYDYNGPIYINTRTGNLDKTLTFKNIKVGDNLIKDVREAIQKNKTGETVYAPYTKNDNFIGYHIYGLNIPAGKEITITLTALATKAPQGTQTDPAYSIMILTENCNGYGHQINVIPEN